tara:strand:- start:102 stop:290 length:189 start_codon:yes stop_codon:yes gene_type:complete
MTPEEFEQNARIVSGDPTWTLDNRIEDVTNSVKDWDDFWYNSVTEYFASESEGLDIDKPNRS